MTTVLESVSIAGLAIVLYVVMPAIAWLLTLLAASLTWRSVTARPLDRPPRTHSGLIRQLHAMVALDPVIFGFVLWVLTVPVAEELQAGGSAEAIDAGLRLFMSLGLVFATASFVAAATQARVFSKRIRDLLGPFSARSLAFLSMPTSATLFALLAGFLTLRFAESYLANPAAYSASVIDTWVTAWLAFGVSLLAFPLASEAALRQDVNTKRGFVRAASFSLVGMVPSLAVLVGFLLLPSAP